MAELSMQVFQYYFTIIFIKFPPASLFFVYDVFVLQSSVKVIVPLDFLVGLVMLD